MYDINNIVINLKKSGDLTSCLIYGNISFGNSNLVCWQLAAIAQSVVRRIGSAEVTGPIPVSSLVDSRGNLVFQGLRPFLYVSIFEDS